MSDAVRAHRGDWVEVECKLLDPVDRSKNLPPETADKPLMMWVKGFAQGEAGIGEELTIETMTGRRVSGALSAVNPGYYITYGDPLPELAHIGRDLRARVAAYREKERDADAGGRTIGAPSEGGEH